MFSLNKNINYTSTDYFIAKNSFVAEVNFDKIDQT